MSNYTSNGLLFRYTISNNTSYVMTADDYTIIQESFDKWDSLVQPNSRFTNGYTIDVSFNISTLGEGILGGAQVLTAYYFDTYTFGNAYTATGKITMNSTYLNTLKNSIRTDGKSSFYHVMLHEIGHILGIGTYWNMSGSPVIGYLDGSETKYYYTGEHAVREYKSYIPEIQHTIIGLPIEDNGGSGTQNVHPEEGEEGTASSNNRYINGYFHPGLDNELMSGWMESYPDSTPLSRITLGFLEDMGFIINYNQADDYQIILNQNYVSSVYNMSNWLDLSNNANTFKSSYIQGFLDINGGNIRTRNPTDHLMIAGDASLNSNLYVGGDISWNPSNISNNSIPSSAIIGGGPTGPQGELGPTGPQGVTGPSTDTADTLTLSKASGDGLVVLADTSLNNNLRVAGDTSMNGTLVVSGETTIGLLNTSTIINGGSISAMTYSIGGQGVISGSRQFTGTDLELKNNNGDSKLIITGETGIAQIDTINEITANAGVTIESVELKDNTITAHTIEATNYSVGSVNFVSATRQGNFRDLEVKSGSNVVTVLIDGDTGNTIIDGRLDTTDASFSKISTTGTADFNGLSTFNNGLTVTSGSVTLPNSSIPSSAIIGGGLTGPQGDKGELGPTGPQGDKGELGVTGPQGNKGELGVTGPQGVTGPSADINSIIQTGTFSITAVKNDEQNTGSNTSVTLSDTGYYYKIGKMVHVSYPRLTKTLLNMTANETLISLSLPFTCDKIASRVCAGQGVSGVFSGISMTDGLPTMIATSGNSTLECKYFTESNVDSVILFNSSSDYVDVTFDYISQ